jgi:glycosyltransferase involved in cell wall biosynthesis
MQNNKGDKKIDSSPRVSVVIASYNHEKYITECITSALSQTYRDFEILVTDDGSSDNTAEIIGNIHDPKIHFEKFDTNRGACTAINNCIRKARGEYIAVLNSDDAWEPEKLQKQVDFLDRCLDVAAVFTKASLIDEQSNFTDGGASFYSNVFDKENRSRYDWLRYFFFTGNCLCHPSILIRKTIYDKLGLYDERMANLPDFDMWVRLCLKYDLHILDDKLVRFRLRENAANASSDNPSSRLRNRFEYKQILNQYLSISDKSFFLKVFPEASKYGVVDDKYIPYFLGRLALNLPIDSLQLWGLETLYSILGNSQTSKEIEDKYGFCYRDFYLLSGSHDIFKTEFLLVEKNRFHLIENKFDRIAHLAGLSVFLNRESKLGRLRKSMVRR